MLRAIIIPFLLIVLTGTGNKLAGQDSTLELKTVVIDPGHGGKDPGATINNIKEKDIVLDVALRAGEFIKKQFPQVNVIYTRNKDVFVPLDKRAEIANKQKADLFISIHANIFESTTISGAETYILGNHRSEENLRVAQMENSVILLEDDYTTRYEGFDPNSAESYIMFELIQNEFLEQSRLFADDLQKSFTSCAKRKSRGVRQAGFLVLRRTTMPSVLIELGFISNKKEQAFLVSSTGKQQMARSIANAFANYKMRIDSRSTITVKEPKHQIPEQKVQKDTIINIGTIVQSGKWYAVQILASREKIPASAPAFKNEMPVFSYFEKGWFKYYLCITKNYDESLQNLKQIRPKFKGAFLVIFDNGEKEKFVKN